MYGRTDIDRYKSPYKLEQLATTYLLHRIFSSAEAVFLLIFIKIYRFLIEIAFGDDLVSILTLDGDKSKAPGHPEDDLSVDGSPTSLGSTVAHNPRGSIYYRIESG